MKGDVITSEQFTIQGLEVRNRNLQNAVDKFIRVVQAHYDEKIPAWLAFAIIELNVERTK